LSDKIKIKNMQKKIISRKEHIANLIMGIVLSLAGLAGIIFLLSLPSPLSEEEIMTSDITHRLIDRGVPVEVILAYDNGNRDEFSLASDTAPIVSEAEWRIRFEEQNSLGGLWRGENAVLRINYQGDSVKCLPENEFPAYSKNKHWMSIHTHDYSKVRPYMKVKVSAPDQRCIHSWIEARARMDLIYPSLSGYGYENNTKTLERELTFFVISEEEAAMLREIIPPNRIVLPVRLLSLAFTGIFFFLGIYVLIIFVKERKDTIILR
jgi:hypothetical protein